MKKFLFIGFLFCAWALQAQVFHGTVFIRDNSILYLNQVFITNLTAQHTVMADYQGDFSIEARPGDKIRFTSIVTDRKDMVVTSDYLNGPRRMIELSVAYQEIQEVVIRRFRPTGNFKVDVLSLPESKTLVLAQKIGLPSGKLHPIVPDESLVDLKQGAIGLNAQSIFDAISGRQRRQARLQEYEVMERGVNEIRQYFGDAYFTSQQIPENLIDNFLQFVYSTEHLEPILRSRNFTLVEISLVKYFPIYRRRLEKSQLEEVLKTGENP